jgi:hypothetical protein
MIDQILKEINNYFIRSVEYSTITIASDELTGFSGDYIAGQYINIDGSILNDGTYKIESNIAGVITLTETLASETTNMYLYGLQIPKSVIDLSTDISTYAQASSQGIASESQGSRSVSYVDGSSWQSVYKKTLNAYRLAISDKERWGRCGSRTLLKSL